MGKDFVNSHKNSKATYDTWDAGNIDGEIYMVDRDLEGGGITYEYNAASRSMDYNLLTTSWKNGNWPTSTSLAATTHNWNPNDDDTNGTIQIKDETGGNLGGEGSEVTGAKQNQAWNLWD